MSIECPATVTTGADGAPLCLDTSSAPVAWTASPPFDVSQLDASTITAYFAWGWFIVALAWVTGKGVSMLVQFIKNVL